MTAPLRWLLVLALAAALVSVPAAVRAWPVTDTDETAAALLERVRASDEVAWSGEVRTQGTLEIPETDSSFDGVARLLGESSQLRVWWQAPDRWRVDRVRESGETDLLRLDETVLRWRYEGNQVRLTRWAGVRLPDDPDVLPSTMAVRMLDGAEADEVSRLPADRIAGRAALGLRLEPADARSTIARVDLWADADSGVALRTEVYATGRDSPGQAPVLSSVADSFDPSEPDPDALTFRVPASADVDRGTDLAEAARRASSLPPPDRVAGLERTDEERGSAAVYGSGPTAIALVPLSDRVGDGLREQLRRLPDVGERGDRVSAEIGPLSVTVVRFGPLSYLLVGTVTPQTLAVAASDTQTSFRTLFEDFGGRDDE